jgi:hypothetical protein
VNQTYLTDDARDRIDSMSQADRDAATGDDAFAIAIRQLELEHARTMVFPRRPELLVVPWDEAGRRVADS